jgi:hypothetical protein
METVAGQQIYEMGFQKGEPRSLKNTQEMLIEALDARFGLVSIELVNQISAINHLQKLKNLFKLAMRCPDLESFKKQLAS